MTLRTTFFNAALAMMLAFVVSSCTSNTSPQISTPPPQVGATISKDTLHGSLKGTMLAGHTYYMDSDIVIGKGDTLLMQEGVTLIVLGNPVKAYYPEIQMYGTFISMGTKDKPNYITVPEGLRKYSNLLTGAWGGIQCAPAGALAPTGSGDLILHWTHVEYGGGAGNPVNGASKAYNIFFQNPNSNFIMEDSWLTGGSDDAIRVAGGKISIFRNVVECSSATSGDFNIKGGTVGDIAYNLFIGMATNGPKLANTGSAGIQTNVNIYNNTVVACGWRNVKPARGGSIDIEDGARGAVYNNVIVNCKTGFRMMGVTGSTPADTAHVYYDHQWYFGETQYIVDNFSPTQGVCTQQLKGQHGSVGANDPMFVSYDVMAVNPHVFDTAANGGAGGQIPWANQDALENVKNCNASRFSDAPKTFSSDFHLKSGSPCIGTAYTGSAPVTIPMNVCPLKSSANPFGATTKGLGMDYGAYQIDGSGNAQ